jgi:YD repeat-containing protein
MKKVFYFWLAAALISCEYNNIKLGVCNLASEETLANYATYGYNSRNEIISYSTFYVHSSTLTYDNAGKIISENDNGFSIVTYEYDNKERLVILTQTVQSAPQRNYQIKYYYNSFSQDTLRQLYTYNSLSEYVLRRNERRNFLSTHNKNYSKIRTYDAATNTLLYTEDFQWDNHPSPYLRNVFFLNGPPPSNNLTKYSRSSGSSTQTEEYTYTYNSNGFPLTKTRLSDNVVVRKYSYSSCR